LRIERASYANLTFFAPILAGRLLMRLTGLRPASENNINVSALNVCWAVCSAPKVGGCGG